MAMIIVLSISQFIQQDGILARGITIKLQPLLPFSWEQRAPYAFLGLPRLATFVPFLFGFPGFPGFPVFSAYRAFW